MDFQSILSNSPARNFSIRAKREGIYQLIAPLFHADGDMMNIYLEQMDDSQIRISDYGMSMMRLSYLFDIDTDKKKRLLNDLILSRSAEMDDGRLQMISTPDCLFEKIMSFSQLVTEVSNMEVLSHETIEQLFYDNLRELIVNMSIDANVVMDYSPEGHPEIAIDYAFLKPNATRPVFLFGVRDTNKAQQATIHCLNLTLKKVPHKSITVFDDVQSLSAFSRRALLNATGKVFDGLPGFKESGQNYIEEELHIA